LFTQKYKLRKDIGNEYFEGNYHNMIADFFDILTLENYEFTAIQNEEKCIQSSNKLTELLNRSKKLIDSEIDIVPSIIKYTDHDFKVINLHPKEKKYFLKKIEIFNPNSIIYNSTKTEIDEIMKTH